MKIYYKKLVRTIATAFCCIGAVSCFDDALDVTLEELGTQKDIYEIPAEEGQLEIEYYSNLTGDISFTEDVTWAKLSTNRFNGDGKLLIDYKYNSSFPRLAEIVFTSDDQSRIDTIKIKQNGEKVPTLQLKKNNLVIYNNLENETEQNSILLKTNIGFDQLKIDINYTGLKDEEEPVKWIKGTDYANGIFIIETENNPEESLRNAVITISFKDGWGNIISDKLFLTQATKSNKLGTKEDFEVVRSLASAGEQINISENIYIEGYIISNIDAGNVAENPMTTNTSIDYKRTDKCAYIESIDGNYGFMIEAASVDDNCLKVNTKVQILLKDAQLEHLTNPDRFVIRGMTASMVIYSEKVNEESIPIKRCRIKDLNDNDIYTLVQLTDCELPIRKGPLTPINDGYANACKINRINMYPLLVRDIDGNNLYMLTNTTCPYRRDGSRLNYGKGSIKGVLVHEKYRRFIDGDSPNEEECGNIGKYQIRHQRREDIAFEEDFNQSFSRLLTEYRYYKPKAGGAWAPTYGENGEFRHTYVDEENPEKICTEGTNSFSYLGPVGKYTDGPFGKHFGNENGFGIILEDGTDWGRDFDSGVNHDGSGWSSPFREVAFRNGWWWNENEDRPYAWLVNFSTKGISTDVLSMQISMMNYSRYTPTYWKFEWSETDSMAAEDDKEWKEIAEVYIPDVVNWAPTQLWQSGAFKSIDFKLPLEMLDKENVYIRIMPASKICSSDHGIGDGQMNMNGGARNAIDYFAIRYNK